MTKLKKRSALAQTTTMLLRLAVPTPLNTSLQTAMAALLQRLAKSSFPWIKTYFQQLRPLSKPKQDSLQQRVHLSVQARLPAPLQQRLNLPVQAIIGAHRHQRVHLSIPALLPALLLQGVHPSAPALLPALLPRPVHL